MLPARSKVRNELWRFILWTFGITWVLWILVAVLSPPRSIGFPMVMLGAFGPSLAGAWLGTRGVPAEVRRDFWRRATSLRLVGNRWGVVILVAFPLLGLGAVGANSLVGGAPVSLDWATIRDPAAMIPLALVLILGGPVSEELGWRGFAQDRLQSFLGPPVASVVLGVIWVIWHAPLFFIPGTSQGAMGFGSEAFWTWAAQVLAMAVIFTWVYNNTGRSILGAVLLHLAANTTFTLMAGLGGKLPQEFETLLMILYLAVAGLILVFTRADGPGSRVGVSVEVS